MTKAKVLPRPLPGTIQQHMLSQSLHDYSGARTVLVEYISSVHGLGTLGCS